MPGGASGESRDREERVDDALAEYLQRVDAGERIDPEAFIAQDQGLESSVRKFFDNLDGVNLLQQPTQREFHSDGVEAERSVVSSCWQPGEVIGGRWQIQQVIEGGMGIVYVVHDHETHERLAAKTYRNTLLDSEAVRRRFEEESRIWLNIPPHPNIIRAKYYHLIEDKPFLFLEFAEDGSLRERLRQLRHFPNGGIVGLSRFHQMLEEYERLRPVILDWALQFCDGMIHAQEHGVIAHRDIKPANCLFQKHVLRITDFGLAKALDAAEVSRRHPGGPAGRGRLRVMLVGLQQELAERIIRFVGSKSCYAVVVNDEQELRQPLAQESSDFIFLEVGQAGYETAKQIRQCNTNVGGRTHIIALSLPGSESDEEFIRRECMQAGIDGCLFTPITSAELFRTMNACLSSLEDNGYRYDSSDARAMSFRTSDDTPPVTVAWETLDIVATKTGHIAGTPTHMAPEQFLGLRHADIRADIYAFGVMLYQMTTGTLPFEAANLTEFRELHSFSAPPDLGTTFSKLNDIVARCLSKNPDHRFCDFAEIREELEVCVFDPTLPTTDLFLSGWWLHGQASIDKEELLKLAHSHILLGEFDRALATLEEISRESPTNGRLWREMGHLLMNHLHRFAEAMECLERARDLGQDVEADMAKCREMRGS